MKCLSYEQFLAYLDQEMPLMEQIEMEQHLKTCGRCQQDLAMYRNEVTFLDELKCAQKVSETFTEEVMAAIVTANQPSVAEQKKGRILNMLKKGPVIAAGIAVTITMGAFLSPTLASYVKSFFQQNNNIDPGLQSAAKGGFTDTTEAKVTDQGITLEVKEVLADPLRVAVVYRFVKADGTIIPTEKPPKEPKNVTKDSGVSTTDVSTDLLKGDYYLTDSNGKMIKSSNDWGWTLYEKGSYRVVESAFSDGDEYQKITPPSHVVFHFNFKNVGETKGSWKLSLPIDLTKSKAATQLLNIDKQYESALGINIKVKEIEFAPSATRLILESNKTPKRMNEIEQLFKKYKLPKDIQTKDEYLYDLGSDIRNWGLAYRLINESGDTVAANDDTHSMDIRQDKNMIVVDGFTRMNGKEPGSSIMRDAFVPMQKNNLWFVLDKIYTYELATDSATFKPGTLAKQPGSIELNGTKLTVKRIRLKSDEKEEKYHEGTNRTVDEKGVILEIEGTLPKGVTNLRAWKLTDTKQREYDQIYDVISYSRDKDGLIRFAGCLFVKGMQTIPDELSLSYGVYEKENLVKDWKIPLQ